MSGEFNGAQKKLSEIVGHLVPYLPCQAHRMNTFVEHACNSSPIIVDLFAVVQELHVFFSGSTKRYSSLLNKLQEVENALKLTSLSRTRWTARAEAVKAVTISFELIARTLQEIYTTTTTTTTFDSKTKTKALGLLKKLQSFDFIAGLMFTKNILIKCKILTESLEAKELNIIDASLLVESTIKSLDIINDDSDGMDRLI